MSDNFLTGHIVHAILIVSAQGERRVSTETLAYEHIAYEKNLVKQLHEKKLSVNEMLKELVNSGLDGISYYKKLKAEGCISCASCHCDYLKSLYEIVTLSLPMYEKALGVYSLVRHPVFHFKINRIVKEYKQLLEVLPMSTDDEFVDSVGTLGELLKNKYAVPTH